MYYQMSDIVQAKTLFGEVKKDALELLVEHFIKKLNFQTGRCVQGVTSETLCILKLHDFCKNISLLEQTLEYGYAMCDEAFIREEHLPKELLTTGENQKNNIEYVDVYGGPNDEVQRIKQALFETRGNKKAASKNLGIDRTTLWRKMKRYKIA
ncbi:MAG: hypothetical protein HQK83_08310 [Fibrobacteria bacterium]|nr:hypothetical protein [Fibrobacteria bacterium]